MKKILVFLLFLSYFNISCSRADSNLPIIISSSDTLNVATFNVRISVSSDKDERNWNKRKPYVADIINSYRFDVFGVQELINQDQEDELKSLLPSFNLYSKGRDNDQGTKGERLAIFYNKQRFSKLDEGYFFLSETPEVASKGWDAALNRICMWVKLADKVTGKEFYFFNTHFDHVGVNARAESAKLIISKIREISDSLPIICVGDFNASPYEKAVYNTLSSNLNDSRKVSESAPTGMVGTFNGWDVSKTNFDESVLIDYIFSKKIKTISYRAINDKYVAESYPSDHFPVFIQCVVE